MIAIATGISTMDSQPTPNTMNVAVDELVIQEPNDQKPKVETKGLRLRGGCDIFECLA